jgi:hypothetical protein
MNLVHVLELVHQLGKACRLRISRKRRFVYHGQNIGASTQEISDLGRAVLKLHNSASTGRVRPEVDAALSGELKKNFDLSIQALIFSRSVYKRA